MSSRPHYKRDDAKKSSSSRENVKSHGHTVKPGQWRAESEQKNNGLIVTLDPAYPALAGRGQLQALPRDRPAAFSTHRRVALL